jgi:hypothetical protein
MKTFNQTIATSVPLNANYNSPYVPLRNIYTYAIQAVITGTPTGTIQLQASNDPETNDTQYNVASVSAPLGGRPPAVAPSNWTTITNSPFVVTSSGIEFWNVNYTGYTFVRVQYIDGSGGTSTATMTITFNGKG